MSGIRAGRVNSGLVVLYNFTDNLNDNSLFSFCSIVEEKSVLSEAESKFLKKLLTTSICLKFGNSCFSRLQASRLVSTPHVANS